MNSDSESQILAINDDTKIIKDLCIKNVPFWNNLNHDDMEIERNTMGFNNDVFKLKLTCTNKNYFPINTLIVKKRTQFTDLMFNTELQHNIATLLGDTGLGPRLIGRFSDFSIQEYVEGMILKNSSFQNLSVITSIASSLAKFHKKGTEISPADWDRTPFIIKQINQWSKQLEEIIKKNNLEYDFNELESSFELYKNLLDDNIKKANTLANSILFCHNDLIYKNFLDYQHGIYFIDFDYAGFNYVGWDIANFFYKSSFVFNLPDYPYFKCDKSLEPSYEFKSIFVSIYLSQLLNKNVLPSDNVVKEFLDSVAIHYLGVNLFWMYWSIIIFDRTFFPPTLSLCPHDHSMVEYANLKSTLDELADKKLISR